MPDSRKQLCDNILLSAPLKYTSVSKKIYLFRCIWTKLNRLTSNYGIVNGIVLNGWTELINFTHRIYEESLAWWHGVVIKEMRYSSSNGWENRDISLSRNYLFGSGLTILDQNSPTSHCILLKIRSLQKQN